ncbi:MAG: aminopeptidase [Firmicutes bacterium]|nr:aminopeptidase [Bacillota bacterium]
MIDKKLNAYAKLIIKQGINLDKGEVLAINADIDSADLVEQVVIEGYAAGARKVTVFWTHAQISKISYLNQSMEELADVPQWVVDSRDYLVDNNGVIVTILSERPDLLKDVPPERIATATKAISKALTKFRDATSTNKVRWCLAAYPNEEWAQKIFPKLKGQAAVDKLWDYIHKTVRLDKKDPIAEWATHSADLARRSEILNKAKNKSIRLTNKIGTDVSFDMPKGYIFTGAVAKSLAGRQFTANMPTEEVFASPDYRTTNGKVVSALPLVRRGAIINDFWMNFKDGKIVEFGAKEGYETLKGIIETDEGAARLGEIAFVGFNSPIQNLKTLFFNTLFDENASCHLAIGRGFAGCIEGGGNMKKEELDRAGINDSLEHVDFMIGTADLNAVATLEDGKQMVIFKDGNWVF